MDDIRFNFYDSPTRTLTEEQFLRPGSTTETWEDAVFRGNRKSQIDSLEKLALSFGSFRAAALSPVEKVILSAANERSAFDERTEVSSERRSENVSALEFLKVFSVSSSSSSSSGLHKSANPEVARTERDELPDGTFSVSEYGSDGRLLRAWIDDGSGLPTMMKSVRPDHIFGVHPPSPETEGSAFSKIFERRATA